MAKKISKSGMVRRLVEMLIYDVDPLGGSRYALSQFAARIFEAWAPEKKREIVRDAADQGNELVDHLVVGDYDLCLWKSPVVGDEKQAYLVSINNAQHDPLSPEAQQGSYKTGSTFPMMMIKEIVTRWARRYGALIIGSYIEERNSLYLKMFKRVFPTWTIKPYYGGDLRYGFKISRPEDTG